MTLVDIRSIESQVNNVNPQDPYCTQDFQSYADLLDSAYSRFQENFEKYIEDHQLNLSDDTLSDGLFKVQSLYQVLIVKLKRAIPESPTLNKSFVAPLADKSLVPLPHLNMERFSGKVSDWPSFISNFNSLIGNNSSLTSLQRFQYLRGLLAEPALDIIRRLPLADTSLAIALDLLKTRFNNPRQSIHLHCNELLSLPIFDSRHPQIMRKYIDTLNLQFESLATISKENVYEIFTVSYLLSKVDNATRIAFENHITGSSSLPSFKDFVNFLSLQVEKKENLALFSNVSTATPSQQQKRDFKSHHKSNVSMVVNTPVSHKSTSSFSCPLCEINSHKIYNCPVFLSKSPKERHNLIKGWKRCFNCLSVHPASKCSSVYKCKTCHKNHHTLLHFSKPTSVSSSDDNHLVVASSSSETSTEPSALCNFTQDKSPPAQHSSVLLPTCLVRLQTDNNNYIIVRALLDSGSHVSFMTEHCAQVLKVKRSRVPVTVSGVGQVTTQANGMSHLQLTTLTGKIVASYHPFLIISKITGNIPSHPISQHVMNAIKPYTLADPTFGQPSQIDVLLGADITPAIFKGSPISLGLNLPYIIETLFGFVLMGTAPASLPVCHCSINCPNLLPYPVDPIKSVAIHSDYQFHSPTSLSALIVDPAQDLTQAISEFWSVEEPPSSKRTTPNELICEKYFTSTTVFTEGRYSVRLPFKEANNQLGDSYNQALHRFHCLERKLNSNLSYKQKYIEFMRDYQAQGHMIPIKGCSPKYFIPHHGIFKSHGDVEKLRVVFDGSMTTTSGHSLNDILFAGPKLQTKIADIITLSRRYLFMFTADICQMFRQIKMHPEDQLYQCILWREDPSHPIQVFVLTTVTYGLTSSPYLALRTLAQLASDFGHQYPRAATALRETTFVDDIIAGSDTLPDALSLRDELIQLLSHGGFQLKKWAANNSLLLLDIPSDHRLATNINSPSLGIPLLGLSWDLTEDHFTLTKIPHPIQTPSLTKRMILSTIAQFYDPCGWLGPVVMFAKCYMQRLWLSSLGWDSPLPAKLVEDWRTFEKDLPTLTTWSISRPLGPLHSVRLHGFCDASKLGYAAVIYLHSGAGATLLMSKTRVAPIKTLSVPRLELLGAHLLASLISHYRTLLKDRIQLDGLHLWCDSTIVLDWLKIHPINLKTFVANRISQILDWTILTDWHYVPSDDNPADIASRGSLPTTLLQHHLWWNGPQWLQQPESSWPQRPVASSTILPIAEYSPSVMVIQCTPTDLFNHLSEWPSIIRAVTKILFWRYRIKDNTITPGFLNRQAFLVICRNIQLSAFPELFTQLNSGRPLSKPFQRLSPFINNSGVICVRGRFSAPMTADYPPLLPKSHRLVWALIDFYHKLYAHAGATFLQAILTRRVWILSARQVIRSRIFKCVPCFKAKPTNSKPLMSDLPLSRITPSPPFAVSGMDFAGPFPVKLHHLKKSPIIKAYLCIFICFSSKAVHLELVQDLSTPAFLDTLQRFISRRGSPSHLHSDCGTNFIGASSVIKKELQQFLKSSASDILKYAAMHEIEFHFNTPASPHQGGLWERAIRAAKSHLTKLLLSHTPTILQLSSLFTRIEGILNSRPIVPMATDPSNFDVLTPGHFLIGRPIMAPPSPDVTLYPTPLLTKYNWVQAQAQRFWARWRAEYLPALSSRSKWTHSSTNLQLNDLVLLEEPNTPSLCWPTGRIIEVHPSADGVVRRVTVKTPKGEYLRPAVRVYRLPLYQC